MTDGMVAEADPTRGTAAYRVSNLPVRDSVTVTNGLPPGNPSLPATVSFEVEWGNPTAPYRVTDDEHGFALDGFETTAKIAWTATRPDGFTYTADADSSVTDFAAVVRERNGRFLTPR